MKNFDQTPPQAVDYEKVILGAILLEKDSLYAAREKLNSDDFYKDSHQEIFKAICQLDDNGQAYDLLTVPEQLKKNGTLEEAGGLMYLTELTSRIASTANLSHYIRVVLEKSVQRKIYRFSSQLQEKALDPSGDVDDILTFANLNIEKASESLVKGSGQKSLNDTIHQSLNEYYERERLAKEGLVSGVPTPLTNLTKITNGWQNSDLIIVAARPSMGKTAFALQIIGTAVDKGYNPAIFSLEMSDVRLIDRILCGKAEVNMERFRNGYLSKDEILRLENAASELLDKGITIDDNSNVSMNYIRSKAVSLHRKGLADMIIIDYSGLIDTSGLNKGTREQEVSYISNKAKQVAKELNIPVVLLNQLNRSPELRGGLKRPQLSDLRESGSLEQDADVVLLLYRPAKYGIDADSYGMATENMGECIVAKHRNGRIGTVLFNHNDSLTRIYDYANEVEKEPF